MTQAKLNQLLAWGGTWGIVGVILVASTTFMSGGLAATSVTLTDSFEDFLAPSTTRTLTEIAAFVGHILAPLCFLASYNALRQMMHQQDWVSADWLYSLAMLGIGFWIFKGGLMVFIHPALLLTPAMMVSHEVLKNIFTILDAGLLDLAYLCLSFHAIGHGYFIRRTTQSYWGDQNLFIGLTMLPILLLGPYRNITFMGVYGYGAPIMTLFGLSVFLLRQADQISTKTSPTK